MNSKVIVMVGMGKGSDGTWHHGIRLFNTTEEANNYINKVNDLESKHYVVAEIVRQGVTYEADRDGFEEVETIA